MELLREDRRAGDAGSGMECRWEGRDTWLNIRHSRYLGDHMSVFR